MRQHTAPLRVADSADGERNGERLRDLIGADLDALEAIVHWNHAHGIEVFRLTSDDGRPLGTPGPPQVTQRDLISRSVARLAELATFC